MRNANVDYLFFEPKGEGAMCADELLLATAFKMPITQVFVISYVLHLI
jgi:hypothetical protein